MLLRNCSESILFTKIKKILLKQFSSVQIVHSFDYFNLIEARYHSIFAVEFIKGKKMKMKFKILTFFLL